MVIRNHGYPGKSSQKQKNLDFSFIFCDCLGKKTIFEVPWSRRVDWYRNFVDFDQSRPISCRKLVFSHFWTYFFIVFHSFCHNPGFLATWDPFQKKERKIPVRKMVLKYFFDEIWPGLCPVQGTIFWSNFSCPRQPWFRITMGSGVIE